MWKYIFVFVVISSLFSCVGNDEKSIPVEELRIPFTEVRGFGRNNQVLWEEIKSGVHASFITTNTRVDKSQFPHWKNTSMNRVTGWKGERVYTQIVLWSKENVNDIKVEVSPLNSKEGTKILSESVSIAEVKYVITDEFGEGCDKRSPKDYDSAAVADILDPYVGGVNLEKYIIRPIWITIDIPADMDADIYYGKIGIITGEKRSELFLEVEVIDRILPSPDKWKFHLDLWQNPFAVARIHEVEPWTDKHFEFLRPYLNMLANAGQKCITTTIIDQPWNSQTFDPFQSMVKWIKKKDGTWEYDYSIFDKWVEFAMSCGITEQINCYTMIPWHLKFRYFDEKTNEFQVLEASPETNEYKIHWKNMLMDFVEHLKDKGWFEKTTISMDERPLPAMQAVLSLVKEVDPDIKITLAGSYHPELASELYDYCVASEWKFSSELLTSRKERKSPTTFYTCCVEQYPNIFTFSPPAEAVWLGWFAAAQGYDGYLRWAYNSWVEDPLHDSRFRSWPGGDTYVVYPGARSSIRFERLREGIQDFEKIHILLNEYSEGSQEKIELTHILKQFEISELEKTSAAFQITGGKKLLNKPVIKEF